MIMHRTTFLRSFCRHYGCPPEEFEQRVFWLCIRPEAGALARLLWGVNRALFQPDIELIRAVQHHTNTDDVVFEISDSRYRRPARGLLRGWLRVRLSGQRLANLAQTLLAASTAAADSNLRQCPSMPTDSPHFTSRVCQ